MNGCRQLVCNATLIGGLLGFGLAPCSVKGQNQAESLSTSFRQATERVAKSIVALRPVDPSYPLRAGPLGPLGPLRPLDPAPRLPLGYGEPDREATGTGTVIDAARGYIVTNDHVLMGAAQAAVVLPDGQERITSQVRRDPGVDLAVLVVDLRGANLTEAKWGDSGALRPGDWLLAIGQPVGAAPAISAGILSARRRGLVASSPSEEWIETDAAINSLNSGGPLINLHGEVIGISTALAGRRAHVVGMSFAIPADRARRVVADLIEFGRVRRAYLGVQIEPTPVVTPGRPVPFGSVVIRSVNPGGPAAEAGLRPGDVITGIAGRPVRGLGMLQALIEAAPIGQDLTLSIERGGQRQDVIVRPRAQPAPSVAGRGIAAPGTAPEPRRGVPSGRAVPPRDNAPPLPAPGGEETPSLLDPVPLSPPPGEAPLPDPPKNQAAGNPR
jgi:serine protease Do